MTIDRSGAEWFGTSNGISRFDGQFWITFDSNDIHGDFRTELCTSTIEDNRGRIWIATWGGGIAVFDGIKRLAYDTNNSGIATDFVYSLVIDSDETKWIGTSKGVSVFDGMNWITYDARNSNLIHDWVFDIVIDQNKNRWIATYKGASVFDGKDWRNLDSSNSGLASNVVTAIASDANEKASWFGTIGGGVSRLTMRSSEVSSRNHDPALSNDYYLSPSYPNPSRPGINIGLVLKKQCLIELEIYDQLGRHIAINDMVLIVRYYKKRFARWAAR